MRRRRLAVAAGTLALAAAGAVALDRLLPPDLSRLRAVSSTVLDRRGEVLAVTPAPGGIWRLPTRVADVDPLYLRLLIAYEDRRFRLHPGIDPLALARAVGQALRAGHVVSGGSTLTLQVVRLLEPRPRTLASKAVEMLRALQLEARFTKDEILGFYLTLAPFGGNVEGVRAASLAWFGREPRHLTPAEAALLVALPQAPSRRRPDRAPRAARTAADHVLDRAAAAGVIPRDVAEAAHRQPLPGGRHPMPRLAPQLVRRLVADAAPGERTIRSTLDAGLQRSLQALAHDVSVQSGDGAQVAIVVADNAARAVRAWVGSAGHDRPGGWLDLARAVRSPGSALKPFIYGMAFDALGMGPASLVDDRPTRFGDYAPRNFDREFQGRLTVRAALQRSLNVPAVAVLNGIGAGFFADTLSSVGVPLAIPGEGADPGLAIALGGAGVSLGDLVTLYAGLAGGGEVLPLAVVAGRPAVAPARLMSASAAARITDVLTGTPRPAPVGQRALAGAARRVAYKTGTSYGFRDAWAVGYTASHTVGVWVGRADGTPRPGHYGIEDAGPVLFAALDRIPGLDGLAPAPQPPAPPAPRPIPARTADGPRILFPAAAARIALARGADGALDPLPLSAKGGTPPLRWVVNGLPLAPDADDGAGAHWRPDGEGFARVVVVDAAGRRAAVDVRVTGDGR